jgi:CheY-like chemotaxis protein
VGRQLGMRLGALDINIAQSAYVSALVMSADPGRFALIVEDDSYSVEILGQYLQLLGVDYRAVSDGKSILEKMNAFSRIDLVFIDLELVGQSGYNVLTSIRSETRWDGVPIVAYTSHIHEKYRAREAGFHSFLGKPLNSSVFPIQLRRMLNNEPVWD